MWKFPCKSSHKPLPCSSEEYDAAVMRIKRFDIPDAVRSDGHLPGPDLIPPVPSDHCACQVEHCLKKLLSLMNQVLIVSLYYSYI